MKRLHVRESVQAVRRAVCVLMKEESERLMKEISVVAPVELSMETREALV